MATETMTTRNYPTDDCKAAETPADAWPPDWQTTPTHTQVYPANFQAVPQWLCQAEKKPWSPLAQAENRTDNPWSWSDPANWMSFADAREWAQTHPRAETDTLAFISQRPDDPYQGDADPFLMVDGDNVRDPDTGAVHPEVATLIDYLGPTYCDVSRSGGGVHAYYVGALPLAHTTGVSWYLDDPTAYDDPTDCPAVELYHGKRQYICSGKHIQGTPTLARVVDHRALAHVAAIEGDEVATAQARAAREPREIDADPATARGKQYTDDFDEVLAAVRALSVHDMRMRSERVAQRADGTEDWDPAIPGESQSESGTRLAITDAGQGVIYRQGNVGGDALDLVAWEEGITSPGEALTGADFLFAVQKARLRGAPIPQWQAPRNADAKGND